MGIFSCCSVRVFVDVLELLLVNVWVGVRVSVVAVFMLVLDVIVIMQGVRVGVRHIPMRVLMGVLFHRSPLPVIRS